MRFARDPILRDLPERFNSKIAVTSAGCWEWTASVERGGYGRYRVGSKTRLAHRVSYEHLVGPIPDGLQLDHLCRNRRCVNPAHLEPVTCKENLMRGETEAARNAAKTHCKHGHELTAANVIVKRSVHRACRLCQLDSQARWKRRVERGAK